MNVTQLQAILEDVDGNTPVLFFNPDETEGSPYYPVQEGGLLDTCAVRGFVLTESDFSFRLAAKAADKENDELPAPS